MKNWHVIFVKTGYEEKVCNSLNVIDEIVAFVPVIEKTFRKQGKFTKERKIMFPSYVFIKTDLSYIDFYHLIREYLKNNDNAIKLLQHDFEGTETLHESEKEFLSKFINDNNVLEESVGIIEGDIIYITKGPLAGYESIIKKINRHKRICEIELSLLNQLTRVTVGLEIVAKV